ncbi:MAG: nitroreductase family protein [Bacillota bacterium]
MSSLSLEFYHAVFRRRSVRSFTGEDLHPEDLAALEVACRSELPLAEGVCLRLVTEGASRVFPRPLFRDVPAFLAVIGKPSIRNFKAAAGYRGEYAVLAATVLGLGTCWVSGTYHREEAARLAGVAPDELLVAIIAIGYSAPPGLTERVLKTTLGAHRKPLTELLDPRSLKPAEIPGWAQTAIEAARHAPSAVNRQPWRFLVEKEAITVKIDSPGRSPAATAAKRLDCGISMLHLELGAAFAGVEGEWEWREGVEVARFRKTTP